MATQGESMVTQGAAVATRGAAVGGGRPPPQSNS